MLGPHAYAYGRHSFDYNYGPATTHGQSLFFLIRLSVHILRIVHDGNWSYTYESVTDRGHMNVLMETSMLQVIHDLL